MRRFTRSAFTIIEVLVVVIVISILAGMIFPAIGRSRENSGKVQCENNLKQIGQAIHTYCNNNGGVAPFEKPSAATHPTVIWDGVVLRRPVGLGLLYTDLGRELRTFYCPAQKYLSAGNSKYGIDNFNADGRECRSSYVMRTPDTFQAGFADNQPILLEKFPNASIVMDADDGLIFNAHKSGVNVLYVDNHVAWRSDLIITAGDTWKDFWLDRVDGPR